MNNKLGLNKAKTNLHQIQMFKMGTHKKKETQALSGISSRIKSFKLELKLSNKSRTGKIPHLLRKILFKNCQIWPKKSIGRSWEN